MNCKFFYFLFAIALTVIPARASLSFSIDQVSSTLTQGDIGDMIEVIMTNSASFNANSFTLEITSDNPGVTFTQVTTGTSHPYVFAGNSLFGPDITSSPGTTLDGGDATATPPFADITLAPSTYGMGLVFFNIDPGAATGPVTFSFGNAAVNVFSDAGGDTITPSLNSLQLNIQAAAVPEPSALLPLAALALAAGFRLRRTGRVGNLP